MANKTNTIIGLFTVLVLAVGCNGDTEFVSSSPLSGEWLVYTMGTPRVRIGCIKINGEENTFDSDINGKLNTGILKTGVHSQATKAGLPHFLNDNNSGTVSFLSGKFVVTGSWTVSEKDRVIIEFLQQHSSDFSGSDTVFLLVKETD